MKDLISIKKLTTREIVSLLDFADEIKEWHKKEKEYKPLKDKTVITSFPATSLRTRISFETGIFQLGANSINMEIEFEGKEPLEDKVGYLNCWIDFLVIRYPSQNIIEQIAKNAKFSVVNAMSRQSHPCEILSDLQTIREKRGDLKNLKFVFVGEGANISNTWFEVAAKLNLNLTQVCPEGYEVNEKIFEYAKINSKGEINITNDIEKGLKYADIILTDGWPVKREDQEQFKKFLPYQINMNNIEIANNDCLINPCPPLVELIKQHKNTNFIIAHLIGLEVFIDANIDTSNILFDISCYQIVPKITVELAVEKFGVERIIMGSDTPNGEDNLKNSIALTQGLELSDKEKEQILGGNLKKLLRIG